MNTAHTVKGRDPVFDALKFFAIFMVLWGHAIQWLSSTEYYDEPVYRIIYSFHMPLFMTIVGYFSVTNKTLTLWQSIIKKARQLILPACSFGVILFISVYYKSGGVKSGLGAWIYGFWFLKSAFCCAVLYYIGRRCFNHPLIGIILTLLVSQFIFMFKINLMYPCFVFGILLNRHLPLIRSRSGIITVFSGILFLTMLLFWDADFWMFPQQKIRFGVQGDIGYYYCNGYRMVIGLVGTLFFISLFQYIFSKFKLPDTIKSISSMGKETLGIYLLQTFLLEMLLPKFLNLDGLDFITFNFIATPLISLVILMACLGILYLIKKSSVLSFILLGKTIHGKKF